MVRLRRYLSRKVGNAPLGRVIPLDHGSNHGSCASHREFYSWVEVLELRLGTGIVKSADNTNAFLTSTYFK